MNRILDRQRREGESYNDVLERVLGDTAGVDFYDGFGMLSDNESEWIQDKHEEAKATRKNRMQELDENFLIDYLSGNPDAAAYHEAYTDDVNVWVMPAPAHAEALVGVGNHPETAVEEAIAALSWGKVYEIDNELSVGAARIADAVGPEGPYLDGVEPLVAAVGRELDAPIVSADSDLTHDATREIVAVEEYRQ